MGRRDDDITSIYTTIQRKVTWWRSQIDKRPAFCGLIDVKSKRAGRARLNGASRFSSHYIF